MTNLESCYHKFYLLYGAVFIQFFKTEKIGNYSAVFLNLFTEKMIVNKWQFWMVNYCVVFVKLVNWEVQYCCTRLRVVCVVGGDLRWNHLENNTKSLELENQNPRSKQEPPPQTQPSWDPLYKKTSPRSLGHTIISTYFSQETLTWNPFFKVYNSGCVISKLKN